MSTISVEEIHQKGINLNTKTNNNYGKSIRKKRCV